ncbi:hypothetical protein AMS61_25900 [Bacillus sp. FJAT-21351]|nr:hypothetical protein AMS61_25900 [Bacillus sp. FJAT-21351]
MKNKVNKRGREENLWVIIIRGEFREKKLLGDKRFQQTFRYKLVSVMYIKPTTIYKNMKLTKHPYDRLFLVRVFIM